MQLDLFKEAPLPTNTNKDMRVCLKCNTEKALNLFHIPYYKSDGSPSHSHTCKECKRHFSGVVRDLKKVNPKPRDSKCQCCGEYTEMLVLDHDHKTDQFRGWTCTNCNQALGKLKESVEIALKAAEYLRARTPSKTEANSSED
jgi:hypothetical protein